MVEVRSFIVFTDYKPLIFAFRQKLEKCSPRQFRYLDYIGQFTTDIRHIAGVNNTVADALSRVEEIREPVDVERLARAQEDDAELKHWLKADTALQLKKVQIPDTSIALYCDVSTITARPFVP